MLTNTNEYNKFFKNAILFFVFLMFFNFFSGSIIEKIFFSQETGKFARITNSIFKDSSDVVIMGSSYATSNYVTSILEKKINLSCYNYGVKGQKIIFQNALIKMIVNRHKPKLIILDISYNWLVYSPEAYERLSVLHPYYWDFRQELEPIFSIKSKYNNIKLLPIAFQMNSTIIHSLYYYFKPQNDYKGYLPIHKKNSLKSNKNIITNDFSIDENFINMLNEFISCAKENNIDLIFTVSPHLPYKYSENVNKSRDLMLSIIDSNNIKLIDFSNNKYLVNDQSLFYDTTHLNHNGAIIFSEILADSVYSLINDN